MEWAPGKINCLTFTLCRSRQRPKLGFRAAKKGSGGRTTKVDLYSRGKVGDLAKQNGEGGSSHLVGRQVGIGWRRFQVQENGERRRPT